MYHLRPIFSEAFINIRKYFVPLILTELFVVTVSLVPPHYFQKTHPIYLLYFMIPQIMLQIWSLIAVYDILSGRSFNLSAQKKIFNERFFRWCPGMIASCLLIFRSMFPFLLPFFLKGIELLFVSLILLFESDDKINAIQKSKAIVGDKTWYLLAIFASVGLIPFFFNLLSTRYLDPQFAIAGQILVTTLFTLLSSVFMVTMYKSRSPMVVIEPAAEAVSYGKIIQQSFLGAIGGILWMIFVFFILFAVIALVVGLKLQQAKH